MGGDLYHQLEGKNQLPKKVEKEVSKIYNIKVIWQCNCDLGLNSKANTPVSELAKSIKSTPGEKTNFAYFFSDIT